jgi:HEAT repeat protein
MLNDSLDERGLIAELSCDDVPPARRRALLLDLREVAGEASVPTLRAQVLGDDKGCQVAATFALAKIGTPAALDVLIDCLHSEPGVRLTCAIRALGQADAEYARQDLISTLSEREDLDTGDTCMIISSLAKAPHRSQVPVLRTMLHDSHSRHVRRKAAEALSWIRAPESQAALEDAARVLSWWEGRPARRALRRMRYRGDTT